jgi:signal transduction histidine kinase
MLGRSSSLAYVQAFVTFGVVASFLATTVATAHHAASIGRDADAIVGNALPSVQLLSSARRAVHRLDAALHEWFDLARKGDDPPLEALGGYVVDIEATLARYQALPEFPGEPTLFAGARPEVTATEAAASRVSEALRSSDLNRARQSLSDERRAAVLADDRLEALVAFNVEKAESLGRDITAVRLSTRRIAFALDALSVALAGLATGLSIVTVRRVVRALQQASDQAERKSMELDRFAGRVAHDILSPLGAMHLALSVMAPHVYGDERADKALRRASRSVTRVRNLVDGLLRYARAAAQPSAEDAVEVSAVVRDVLDGMRREAQDRGIQLEVEGEGEERAYVKSSVGVLTSLVSNLVQNAIKYMGNRPRRLVTVRTRTTDDHVRVEVEDTGPGVPAEVVDSIFEPFVRGVTDDTGIGLGLATVRQLVRAHGGEVSLESRPGNGSLFWFDLPRAHGGARP